MAKVPIDRLRTRMHNYSYYLYRLMAEIPAVDGHILASAPLLPLTLRFFSENDIYTPLESRQAGQYSYNDLAKRPYSMVMGAPGAPSGLSLTQDGNFVEYTIAFDPGTPNGGMTGNYSLRFRVRQDYLTTFDNSDPNNNPIRVRVWTAAQVPMWNRNDGTDYCNLLVGKKDSMRVPYYVSENMYVLWPTDYLIFDEVLTDQSFSSLDYPARHSLALGELHALLEGDLGAIGGFARSRVQADYDHDVYDVLNGMMDFDYPDYYIFGETAWPDAYPAHLNLYGDKWQQHTTLPVPENGYPHESKVACAQSPELWSYSLTALPLYRMLWMLHMLKKYRDPDRQYTNPMVGAMLPGIPVPITVTAHSIADEAITYYNLTNGLGYPPATHTTALKYQLQKAAHDAFPGIFPDPDPTDTVQIDVGASYPTAIFAIYMTILGYGYGYEWYQPYADAAMEVLGKATWGDPYIYGASNCLGHIKECGTTSFYRPLHGGGVMTSWKAFEEYPYDQLSFYVDPSILDFFFYASGSKMAASGGQGGSGPGGASIPANDTYWETHPTEAYLRFWCQLAHQNAAEPVYCPTSMEATALTYIATAYYIRLAYNEHAVYSNWDALTWIEPRVYGRVVNSSGQPIPNVDVWLLGGNVATPPADPDIYVPKTSTDNNGNYSLPYFLTGDHTVFVRQVANCALKPASIQQLDQVVRWPDIML